MDSKLVQEPCLAQQPRLDADCTKGRFENQVAIVTGGCGGLGSAFVYRLVNDGASVAIFDLNEERAKELTEEIGGGSAGKNIRFYHVDVSCRDKCFRAVDHVVEDFGKVNHLINAVAYFGSKVSL